MNGQPILSYQQQGASCIHAMHSKTGFQGLLHSLWDQSWLKASFQTLVNVRSHLDMSLSCAGVPSWGFQTDPFLNDHLPQKQRQRAKNDPYSKLNGPVFQPKWSYTAISVLSFRTAIL